MASHLRLQLVLAVAVLVGGAAPGRAVELDRLLLDDTNAVAVFNVKQILAAEPVHKHYKDLLPQVLAANADVQQALKALGLDPLKDIDRVVFVMGKRSLPPVGADQNQGHGGPLVLVQGRFDPAKFEAFAEQSAKAEPKKFLIKTQKVNGIAAYEVNVVPPAPRPSFVAVLDNTTVIMSPLKDLIDEAVKKAAGAKVALKDPQIQKLFETASATQGVAMAAVSSMVMGGGSESTTVNGKAVTKTWQITIGDQGIDTLAAEVTIGKKVEARITIVAKDADKAQLLARALEDTREKLLPAFPVESELAPLNDAVKKAKIDTDGKTIQVRAQAGEQLVALPLIWLMNLATPKP